MSWGREVRYPGKAMVALSVAVVAVAAGLLLLLGTSRFSSDREQPKLPQASAESLASALPASLNPSRGKTFFVSSTGSDTNSGTRARPWRTIEKALSTLRPGQRALVGGGTYTENLTINRAGTSAEPITLAAYPGATVVLHPASAQDARGDWIPLQIGSGAAYVRVHGFVIENALGTSAADVYFAGTANHVELSGNELRYSQDQGIFAGGATSFLYIIGNRIHDNGWNHVSGQHQSHGIYIEGGNDLIANNLIYSHRYGFGIQIYPANHDTAVVDNTIASSGHSSIVVGGSGGVSNITIRNNILYEGDFGVETDTHCPTGTVAIDHNVIYAYKRVPVEEGCSSLDTSAGNILADPLFVDYANRDLQVQGDSPAVGAATADWSMRADFEGVLRSHSEAPDVGALEARAVCRPCG